MSYAPTLINKVIASTEFNADGLVPVIAQDASSKQVLMMAWMNEEALRLTLETGDMHYWSRSRQSLWRKGETSGNTQRLASLKIDCDGDTLLAEITQKGPACHTGRQSCFFREIDEDAITESGE